MCVCLCIPPIVAGQRLGKNPIVARQRLDKNPPIVARQQLGSVKTPYLLGNGSVETLPR
jgi:hypothetical protein